MKSLTVFLDTSVILSGLISSTGGSGKLLTAGAKKKIKLIATEKIVREAASNLSKVNIQTQAFENLLSSRTIQVINTPSEEKIMKFIPMINDPGDAHVLAGVVHSRATILISLDKKHILVSKVKRTLRPIKIFSPKQFWKWLRQTKPLNKL
ncbi:putative toxin-antitoxin system toxin component, PIN family [Candidatus Collierbacteria bacterium]|nr:putative toxin-antitoxin system toxin component, PIN family [Candidatus Collierbacteria bacterium]